MSIRIIQERLDSYKCQSRQEEENAIREITQEVALLSLYNADFFKRAVFHGGTCLRVFYGMNRFSEDLDFALIEPDPAFNVKNYLEHLYKDFEAFGYAIDVKDRSRADRTVKTLFLKNDSIGKILNLTHPKVDGRAQAIRIKLEVDTKPPSGGKVENKFYDFPLNFAVTTYDLPSLFGGKSHALLCREYVKGRDWYDFLWYSSRKTQINYDFLSNAIDQQGPWQGKRIQVNEEWYLSEMEKKIKFIDWDKARDDVKRFIRPVEHKSLELWGVDFFLSSLERLANIL